MAIAFGTESMSSTDIVGHDFVPNDVTGVVQSVGSTPVGLFMNSFLDRCLNEEVETPEENSWGEGNGRSVTDIENLVRPSNEEEHLHEDRPEEPSMQVGGVSEEQQELLQALCRDQRHAARFLALGAVLLNGSTSSMSLPWLPVGAQTSPEALQAMQALAGLLSEETIAAAEAEEAKNRVPALRYVRRCSRRTTLKKDQTEACPICLEKLSKTQKTITLPCFHKMHTSCCTKYFKTAGVKPMCPICRFDMGDAA